MQQRENSSFSWLRDGSGVLVEFDKYVFGNFDELLLDVVYERDRDRQEDYRYYVRDRPVVLDQKRVQELLQVLQLPGDHLEFRMLIPFRVLGYYLIVVVDFVDGLKIRSVSVVRVVFF